MYGADIGLLHSLKSLDRARYYPIVILPSDMPPPGMLSSELERLGVEYHVTPLGILRRKYLTARGIVSLGADLTKGIGYVRRLARERHAALVYINTIVTLSGAIGGKLAGVPVLWHVREILAMPRLIRWVLHRSLSVCADRIVCISKAVRDSLLNEAPYLANKSLIVYNAVSLSERGNADQGLDLRRELGVPRDAPLVGMVGRVTHWKGQEILAEAAGQLLRNHPDVHFVAVGSYFADESHYLDKLKSLIVALGLEGRFHLTGYRSNVADVYRALDIFVLPSRKPEPFGRVTVEAMIEGRAVIATNHGGTCELISEGETGMLVPPSDPNALKVAIEKLLDDRKLRETIGRSAAKYAHEHFGLLRYREKMQGIIETLVAAG
jgi:glycosyltransferase involved in cell wall biosynthesis